MVIDERNRRKRYTPELKAQFVLHCLSGKQSAAAACREYKIAPSGYYNWRKRFIDGGIGAFRKQSPKADRIPQRENRTDESVKVNLSLLRRYSDCLRANYPPSSRLPICLKLEIIDMINAASISKSRALELVAVPRTSYYSWFKRFKETGNVLPRTNPSAYTKIAEREDVKAMVFKVLHAPPSDYGFNRTTWRYKDLQQALQQSGTNIGRQAIREIVRNAGYRWRKAKKVLTSNDPDYRKKIDRVRRVLGSLGPRDGFFSIDEFGPFAVKHRQGKKLVAPGETLTVPQWQKSKGALIITAALELATNQVTHFYSTKKDTEEMIKLLDLLLETHRHLECIYLSWDAASWHASKKLFEKIESNNVMARVTGSTRVEVAPLPAGAQFLNVIEAIFSGMARAVIHNSNYQSLTEAKNAIDTHFIERNQFFKKNPKRAGKKIWGKERVSAEFSEGQNCKDPSYR